MSAKIVPVILSGGSGTRLWPMSRPERPKQLLPLTADETMLQLTARRAIGDSFGDQIVVANVRHADLIEEQMAEVGAAMAALILEPVGRNSAPAIALAALAADPGAALLVMSSDHAIADVPAFHAAARAALPLVDQGWLVTFGITPDGPDTSYGYLKLGEEIAGGVMRVERFIEKPPLADAEAMVAAGGHAWNSGIFLFRADAFLAALGEHEPAMLDAVRASMDRAERAGARIMPDADAFAACRSESVDYAVMERADRVAAVPVSMGWSDVGSWDALHAISDADARGNAHRGRITAIDTENCLVRTDGARIAMVGVSDLIVVASGDDILILPRGRSQEVKALLAALDD